MLTEAAVTPVQHDREIPRLANGLPITYECKHGLLLDCLRELAKMTWMDYADHGWYNEVKQQLWVPAAIRFHPWPKEDAG